MGAGFAGFVGEGLHVFEPLDAFGRGAGEAAGEQRAVDVAREQLGEDVEAGGHG